MPLTLRQLAGLKPIAGLTPAQTALVLIDIQMDYFTPDKLFIPDGARVLENASRLREAARACGMTIVHIQQLSPNPKAALFAQGSAGAEIHPALKPALGELVIPKTLPGSFARTNLHEELSARGITTLILAGLMTHMCVETTARDALPLGYAVLIAADACASRALPAPFGDATLSHEEVHRNALAALADRFADIHPTDELIDLMK